jgi:hypothetical protein
MAEYSAKIKRTLSANVNRFFHPFGLLSGLCESPFVLVVHPCEN